MRKKDANAKMKKYTRKESWHKDTRARGNDVLNAQSTDKRKM